MVKILFLNLKPQIVWLRTTAVFKIVNQKFHYPNYKMKIAHLGVAVVDNIPNK
jgi:hypothetical protein